jgi:hypothetical protein
MLSRREAHGKKRVSAIGPLLHSGLALFPQHRVLILLWACCRYALSIINRILANQSMRLPIADSVWRHPASGDGVVGRFP